MFIDVLTTKCWKMGAMLMIFAHDYDDTKEHSLESMEKEKRANRIDQGGKNKMANPLSLKNAKPWHHCKQGDCQAMYVATAQQKLQA